MAGNSYANQCLGGLNTLPMHKFAFWEAEKAVILCYSETYVERPLQYSFLFILIAVANCDAFAYLFRAYQKSRNSAPFKINVVFSQDN